MTIGKKILTIRKDILTIRKDILAIRKDILTIRKDILAISLPETDYPRSKNGTYRVENRPQII